MAEEEEITGEIEPVSVGREKLSATILDRAKTEIEKIGVELIDVQLRRIAYEKSVEEKAYQRMISERKRIAEKIRSIGKGEVAKIQGKTEKDLQEIQSEAYRRVQAIKGEAEARSIKIYAAALEEDPEFYKFIRTLEAYQKSLRGDTRYLLSSESEFLNLMRSGHIND